MLTPRSGLSMLKLRVSMPPCLLSEFGNKPLCGNDKVLLEILKRLVMLVEMELSRIIIQENSDQQFIFLKERDGERSFPIVIGIHEAIAIDRRLKGIATPRPMTHDLLHRVICAMGGNLERVLINDIRDHTFYALLVINRNGELLEIDSRPSDAIALGALENTPIFVAEHVLDEVI